MTQPMMAIAVTGSTGQLGGELCRQLGPVAVPFPRALLDLARPDTFSSLFHQIRPEVVINCAGWTAVDAAEQERDMCFSANATGVAALAEACRNRGILLVQLSTDYVFGADRDRREPYREDEPTGPVNVYGASKVAGEKAVEACDHLIIRTCGLYSASPAGPIRGRNFADTILTMARERAAMRVVNDQFCTPSYVPHVAKAIVSLLAVEARGVCNVVNAGSTTWHGFAKELAHQVHYGGHVTGIPSCEYPTRAARPNYSVLSTERLTGLGLSLPDWRAGIKEYLAAQGGG